MTSFRYAHRIKLKKLLAASLAGIMLAAGPVSSAVFAAESETAGEESSAPSESAEAPSQPQPQQPAPPAQQETLPANPEPAPAQTETPPVQDPASTEPAGDESQTAADIQEPGTDIPVEPEKPSEEGGEDAESGSEVPGTEMPGADGDSLTEEPTDPTEPEDTGDTEKKDERVEDEHELEEADLATGRNEDLFVGMTITSLPSVRVDYRFYHVDCEYSMARFRVYVREDQSDSARIVGTIPYGGLMYVLEDLGDWAYVESGDVRGFARSEAIYDREQTARMLEEAEKQISSADDVLSPLSLLEQIRQAFVPETGSVCIPPEENKALTFTKATGRAVAEKEYAFAKEALSILEGTGGEARPVGSLEKDGVCYILTREDEGYVFVESGDVRGFVRGSSLITGSEAVKMAEETDVPAEAEKLVDPLDNKALFHTILSVKNGDKSSGKRQTLIELARKCLGHAYIWGGIDPFGRGADCSGFVQTLYKCLGISLPRVAQAQAYYSGGIKIPVSDAAPGDLIFFARNGYIYHVAMCYDNNGGAPTTIEALGRNYGICYYHTAGRDTIWALRILE